MNVHKTAVFCSYAFAAWFGTSISAVAHFSVVSPQFWEIFVPGALWYVAGSVKEVFKS